MYANVHDARDIYLCDMWFVSIMRDWMRIECETTRVNVYKPAWVIGHDVPNTYILFSMTIWCYLIYVYLTEEGGWSAIYVGGCVNIWMIASACVAVWWLVSVCNVFMNVWELCCVNVQCCVRLFEECKRLAYIAYELTSPRWDLITYYRDLPNITNNKYMLTGTWTIHAKCATCDSAMCKHHTSM